MFLPAQVFKEEKYLRDAMECSDVIWQRGLLRKGYGICHGTAGNGYSFLSLYRLTQDKKYLYRACKVGPSLQAAPEPPRAGTVLSFLAGDSPDPTVSPVQPCPWRPVPWRSPLYQGLRDGHPSEVPGPVRMPAFMALGRPLLKPQLPHR